MSKYGWFFVFSFIFYSAKILADSPTHTLFAVDVSLSASEKKSAFDIIEELISKAPETHSVGLTLFDDTVRGFVTPALLDNQQIKILHQTMTDAPVSVLSTSNLAVGIERAIDAFEPLGGANLVVFSRGVIDTKSQDPRAQFEQYIEWLDKVLLPQAAQRDIAVKLLVNETQSDNEPNINSIGKEINRVFARADKHAIVSWTSGTSIAPELIGLLKISDWDHGDREQSNGPVTGLKTTVIPEDKQSNTIDAQKSFNPGVLSIARLVLLAVCLALLIGIFIWRYQARRSSEAVDTTSQSSSSYLPLTRKPSEAMEEYMEKETDLVIKPNSKVRR